jgi:hypothetical protein
VRGRAPALARHRAAREHAPGQRPPKQSARLPGSAGGGTAARARGHGAPAAGALRRVHDGLPRVPRRRALVASRCRDDRLRRCSGGWAQRSSTLWSTRGSAVLAGWAMPGAAGVRWGGLPLRGCAGNRGAPWWAHGWRQEDTGSRSTCEVWARSWSVGPWRRRHRRWARVRARQAASSVLVFSQRARCAAVRGCTYRTIIPASGRGA